MTVTQGPRRMSTSSKVPTCNQLMTQLRKLGKESHRKTLIRHGAPADRIFGVPIGDLKPIQKKLGKSAGLASELFATGNADAQYLAGLIADEKALTRTELKKWAREAAWSMISAYAVGAVAAESPHAVALGLQWIDAKAEKIALTGWATLSGYVSVTPDDQIDMALFEQLLDRCVREIHEERNEVRDAMNSFVMAVGCYVSPLSKAALAAAMRIGKVVVDHGETACKTHVAADYIRKVEGMGRIGKKRKSARC